MDPNDYAGHPKKMAEYLYGHVKDLGNTDDGDGYKYRGRGVMQLTGKYNYDKFTTFYDNNYNSTLDFVENPGLIASNNKLAVESGMWFFKVRVSNDIDGTESVKDITKDVNGGTNGLADRKDLFSKIKQFITDCLK